MTPTTTPDEHVADEAWRDLDAAALEEHVRTIERWRVDTENLIAQFELRNDGQVAQVLRSALGLVRERRNGLADKAREIRGR